MFCQLLKATEKLSGTIENVKSNRLGLLKFTENFGFLEILYLTFIHINRRLLVRIKMSISEN